MVLKQSKFPHRSGMFKRRKPQTGKVKKEKFSANIRKDLFNIPNSITYLRILLIPFVIVLLSLKTPLYCVLAVAIFAIAAISDFFDGYLARRLKLVSVTGKFLDPLADKLMVMATTIQLAAMGWLPAWIPILVLARELAVQGLRQIAVGEGLIIAAGTGGKLKTALQLVGLVGLLVHYTYPIHILGWQTSMNFHRVGLVLFLLSLLFSLLSAYQYFKAFIQALDKKSTT